MQFNSERARFLHENQTLKHPKQQNKLQVLMAKKANISGLVGKDKVLKHDAVANAALPTTPPLALRNYCKASTKKDLLQRTRCKQIQPNKITVEGRSKVPLLHTQLWNMLHLLVHFVLNPLSFEVLVQIPQPELLQGVKSFNALGDPRQP